MLIVWKGGSSRIKLNNAETVGVIIGVGAAVALLVAVFFLPWLYRVLLKNDWQLKWWHIPLGPLLLRRGEAPPMPEGHMVVQDYYRDHLTLEELQAQRAATKTQDLERSHEHRFEKLADSNLTDDKIHPDGPDVGHDASPIAATAAAAPPKLSIIGPRPEGKNSSPAVLFWQLKRVLFRGVEKDVVSMQKKRNILSGDLEAVHAHAKHYDNRAEYMYSFLQAMTAATASFTHGANDVSK